MPIETKLVHARFGLLCAPIFSVLVAIGWLGLAHFWAPVPADAAAEATKQFFTVIHHDGMIWRNSLLILACGFLVVASIRFGLVLAEVEGRQPPRRKRAPTRSSP